MRYYIILLFLSLNLILFAKKSEPTSITLFENTNIRFDSETFPTNFHKKGNLTWITNGRIAIRKINVSKHLLKRKAKLEIRLTSNGDPWDKAGSIFVIPQESKINLLNLAKGETQYPKVNSTQYEKLVGTVTGKGYIPTVELMRFMTPFGVGYFSNDTTSSRMPVYIDGWAKEVVWTEDITDLLCLLKGEVHIGMYIDTWTKAGYNVSAKIIFGEKNYNSKTKVLSLLNTNIYMQQAIPDIFARKDMKIPFYIPSRARNVRLKYIVSGHGGHSEGDEFTQQKNILSVDRDTISQFIPWRTDCASFRRYNPTSGNWLIKRKAKYIGAKGAEEKEIEEAFSSSDASRSNWCPGSCVEPVVIPLKNITKGNHTLTISIPNAQPMTENELNFWLVSAYLVWEE